MKKFEPDQYYQIIPDDVHTTRAKPLRSGMDLIIQYLHEKYHSNIQQYELPFYFLEQVEEQIGIINKKISEARNQQGDFRCAWIIGTNHGVFFAYIKQGNEEAIFYSDTLGVETKIPNFPQKLAELTQVPVYASLTARQAAKVGCYVDGIVFGRDITGCNIDTGKYRIADFLSVLKERVQQKLGENSFEVKLPNELLKTSQISKFTDFHSDPNDKDKIIHKNETLAQFRNRYSKKVLLKDNEKIVSTYIVEKEFKYLKIIEIQFYLNQIIIEFEKNSLIVPEKIKKEFIAEAKKVLKSQVPKTGLHIFATSFLEDRLKIIKQTVAEIKEIETRLCNELTQEMNDLIKRKKVNSSESLSQPDKERYNVVKNLHDKMQDITQKIKENLLTGDDWRNEYQKKLTQVYLNQIIIEFEKNSLVVPENIKEEFIAGAQKALKSQVPKTGLHIFATSFLEDRLKIIKQTVTEIEVIETSLCNELTQEMNDLIKRKKIKDFESLAPQDKERFNVVKHLHESVQEITKEIKGNLLTGNDWRNEYQKKLTQAIKSSLMNKNIEKYSPLRKLAKVLLNILTILFSPIKRAVTGSWFFSTEGKSKEAVRRTHAIAKKITK